MDCWWLSFLHCMKGTQCICHQYHQFIPGDILGPIEIVETEEELRLLIQISVTQHSKSTKELIRIDLLITILIKVLKQDITFSV